MILLLTEKPSQARSFADALGGMSGTFDGEQYRIIPARGHLFGFDDPANQVGSALTAKYKSWNVNNLPWASEDMQWKYIKLKDTQSALSAIKTAANGCSSIAICTDVDPSGEGGLLAWEIIKNLKLAAKTYYRLYFTDESKKSIQDAFKKRVVIPDIDKHDEVMKAFYRSRWDFMSMQFTRIATAFGDGQSVLRQGRLKSAIVLLVGDQLDALNNYKAIPFYENRFKDENGITYTNPDEPRFPDKNRVPQTYHASAVVKDSSTICHTAPPKFLTLATLSARLATKGYKPKYILDLYQKMYEKTYVSYPRTEDATITPEQFKDMLPNVDAIANVVGVNTAFLTHRQPRNTHVKAKGAHGANRPGPVVPQSLQWLDATFGQGASEIYELVARSFLACLAEDYEYESQKGHVADYPKFVGNAQIPKKMGWKKVFNDDADDDDADVSTSKGLGTQAQPFVFEGFPPKPVAPTIKWLVKELNKHNIGTGATQTSTISEVSSDKAKYPLLIEKRGKLTLAQCGEMSHRLLPGTAIGSLDVTKQIQDEMEAVANGTMNPEAGLAKIADMVRHDIAVMQKNGEDMRRSMGITYNNNNNNGGGSGMAMDDAERFEGTWNNKKVRPKRTWSGHRFTDDECRALLAGDEIAIEAQGKNGAYKCKVKLDNCSYNGHDYVGVTRTGSVNDGGKPDGRFTGIPASWCGHKFTDDEKALLEAGKPVALMGCISKKGSSFDCKMTYDKDTHKLTPIFN